MTGLPALWRTELYHPLVVHFPIALLFVGSIAWLAGQFATREGTFGFLTPASRAALALGTISVWVAIYTGSLADAEVVRQLCDPTVVEEHENIAYVVGWIFSGALLVEVGRLWLDVSGLRKHVTRIVIAAALIAGSGLLGYVGHLGASLVYQQAAGVYHPTKQCEEFE